ncbi:MAG: hypothetical protein V1798_00885 [Pseudomonadota bacterium]
MKNRLAIFLLVVFAGALSVYVASCTKPEAVKQRETAEKKWGSERVCMPCHIYQEPIARQHNYRCDTCHLGNPYSEDETEGHYAMIVNPQTKEELDKTCDKCHRRELGRAVPYDAEFIRDVLVSHKPSPEQIQWQR